MTSKLALAGALVAAFLLTACGGGGSESSLPTAIAPQGGALQARLAPSRRKRHKVKAKIRILIPRKHKRHRIRIRGHYVSPATQSIAISMTLNGGTPVTQNVGLTVASNPDCVASLVSPLICTVTFSLQPGSYTASFETFDGPISGGQTTGNALSQNDGATFSIVAGQDNAINVSLDGIATGVDIVPAANSSFFGNASTGYSISKCGTASPNGENVGVFGTDADGNLIIGPGAPATTLASNDATLMAVATPAPSAPNVYTISHPISTSAQTPATLTATATTALDAGGGTQTAHTSVQALGGTNICGYVTTYALGNAGAGPTTITAGPDGNLWFTESTISSIGTITTAGVSTDYRADAGAYPNGIVSGPGSALWFADSAQFTIGEMSTAGAMVNAYQTGGSFGTGPNAITLGPDGNLWYTRFSGAVGQMTSGGVDTEYSLPGNAPESIVTGPDHRLWMAQGSSIGASTTGGTISEYTSITMNSSAMNIAAGPDNKLWFTETGGNRIANITTNGSVTEFTSIVTPNTGPGAIAAGPDDALWFVERNTNAIARVTTDGTSVTEYPISTPSAGLSGIVAGPDGAMWFTDCADAIVGKIQ